MLRDIVNYTHNKMEITALEKSDEREWDDFVMKSKDSTFYHQTGWMNIVEKTYGHKPTYLIAKQKGEIMGVLPLFLMESRFFGKKIVSVPFGPYGGVCADSETTENMLFEEAKRITHDVNANYLEFRHMNLKSGFISDKRYFTLILDLDPNTQILWDTLRKSMRRYVRKAEENNLEFAMDSGIDNFYDIYAHNMRDLGSPVHSPDFFNNISKEFPKDTVIATVKNDGEVVAAMFLLYFKNTVIYGWGSSLKEYSNLYPNYLLFWEAIKHSCENGFRFFDFGRSQRQSGTFFFKEGWGATPKQLYYQYHLNKSIYIPNTSQSNPKRQMFAKLWRKLPVSVTNVVGPVLRRNFP